MARAQLIEPEQMQGDAPETEEYLENAFETDNEAQVEEPEDTSEQESEPDLPEKYKGKSIQDIIRMHQEAEKHIGKQSSEVGELRKVVDDFIRSQSRNNQTPQSDDYTESEAEEVDFYTDPQAAVKKAIESHPDIQAAHKYSVEYRQKTAQAEIQAKHPDMQEILQDPKFGEWIQASKIRTQLLVQADQNYDTDAADELFTLWKERKSVTEAAVQAEKKASKAVVKQASTGSRRASSEQMPKKKYRRQDIIRLMQDDPKRYEALQPEIMQAYAEGRVV
jgi:hypothetical protein